MIRGPAALLALAVTFAACGEQVWLGGDQEPSTVACTGLPCGAPCLPASCPADAGPCDALDLRGACDTSGTCVAAPPMCPPPYDPCKHLMCGGMCSPCDPSSPGCMMPPMPTACDTHGKCVDATKTGCPPPPYDPCMNKPCPTPCTTCDPDNPDCMEPPGMKACDAMGKCALAPVMCSP